MINQILEILFEEDNPRIVAIYGGGFKPPTKGHFAVVEKTLAEFPEIDELIVYVGGGVRDGITQEESIKIWEIYKNYLSPKVKILPSIAPVKSVLDYAKENPTDKIYWVLGAREGDEEDIKDIENRTRSVEKYPNLEVKVITTKGGVSGTKTRQAIKAGNKEQFFHLIPDVEEKEEIWNLVTPVVKEIKNKRAEIIKAKKAKMEAKKSLEEGFIENTQENMKKLLLAIKQEGKETRDAFKLVLQAAKGEIQLTDEQKKQIGDQLKDVLKSIGLISIAILPGSFIVGALIKIFKAERLVFPSALLPEVGEANLKPYKWEEVDVEGYFVYTRFITDSETQYDVDLESKMYIDDDFNNLRALGVEFAAKPKGAEGSSTKIVVNKGELYRVMATIVDIVKKYVKKSKAQVILYSPAKKSSEEDFGSQRDNLYKTFLSKAFPGVKFEQEGEIVAAILPNNKVKDLQENIISETMTVYRLGEIPYDEKSFFVTPDYKTWIKFYPGEEIHKITTNKLYLPLRSKSFSSWDELRSKYDSGEFTDDDVSYINPEESGIQDFEQYEIKPDDIIDLEPINLEEGRKKKPDPKKGTGKKPEGSGRRLYTDEDPKDTVHVKFKTKEDIVDTLNKASFKAKSHARQSQIINLIHQRVRAAYGKAKDPEVKSRLKRALDYIESRKESSKEKTKRLNKLKENQSSLNYKNIEFGQGSGDKLFDYYYPDLSSIGATQEQMDNTYLATNKKRHLHVQIDPSLQGKGLAAEIIKAFIYREGYRVIPKGRITNPDMIKVLDKIKQDPKFSVEDDGDEYIIDEKYSFNEQYLKESSKEKTKRLNKLKEEKELNVQDLAYQQIPGLLEKGIDYGLDHFKSFIKSFYKWSGTKDKNEFFDFIESLNGEIKRLPLSSIIPSQKGEDYKNASSEYEAEEFQKILDGEKSVDDHRKEDFYPIVVNKRDNKIIDGNHRHYALSSINSPYAVVLYIDVPEKYLSEKLKEFEGDSNPLNLPHIDTWHDGQYKAQDGKTEEAIKLMTKAADEAEKYAKENQDGGVAGEAGYYRGTIAWLKKDYTTVEKYINDKFVKFTGNDEVLKRLLKNKDKSYKEAYNLKEASDPQAGTALPYGSGFAPVKESDPFGLNEFAKQFVKEVFEEGWNFEEGMVSLTKYMIDNGMNIKPLPKIKVIDNDKDNASKLLGKTAHYDPVEKSITLFTMNRHPKDVLRSFAHEMIHHEQNLENKLGNINTTNTNEGGDLPEIEREAYEKGNMMLRNWEDSIKAEKYLKEYKQKALTELFEKDLPNIEKTSKNRYLVSNKNDIEAEYIFDLVIPEKNIWSLSWYFTPKNTNTSPEAWKQVTTTSFKVLKDWLQTNSPKSIHISGNTGTKTKLYKTYIDKLQTLLNNKYKIDNSDEDKVVLRSIEEIAQSGIKKRMETLNESYQQALYYWQNGDVNSKSKIERWDSIKKKIQREVLCELYSIKNV